MTNLGLRLRNSVAEKRQAAGLTQADLAKQTNLSRLTVRQVERDEGYVPSGTVQLKLAQALGIPVHELFWSEPIDVAETAEAAI